MIIYNVTTKVHRQIHHLWLQWLRDEHIPGILNTECFSNAVIVRLLEIDEADGPTYAVQYHAESKSMYNLYTEKYAATMSAVSFKKWGDQFISFGSVMQVVN